MSLRDERASRQAGRLDYYDTPTLIFHWLTALLVVLLFGTSLIWNYLTPHDRFWRPLMEGSHVSLGILFAVLIVVRIVWRLTGGRRVEPEAGLSGVLSRGMYGLLYVLLCAEAVLGFMLRWAQGEEFGFFGLFTVPALMAKDRGFADLLETWHNWGGWAIVILSLGHAGAALVHHYFLKDEVLEKMLYHRRKA